MQVSIQLNNIGKKFVNEWIFKDISLTISPLEKIAVLGSNGSGKSTFLQSIASFLILTKGTVEWKNDTELIGDEDIYRYLSMASPYMELIEDLALMESIAHQKKFKPFANDLSVSAIVDIMQLQHASNKYLKNFSSGMKQRVKLALAILADCPVLLLDEPCTNLDANSIKWYQAMITQYAANKTIIVCSNTVKEEYAFCTRTIEIEKYK